jgi:hypothetical protein
MIERECSLEYPALGVHDGEPGEEALERDVLRSRITVTPLVVREPLTAANTSEKPRQRCASWDGVRSCSRLFVV